MSTMINFFKKCRLPFLWTVGYIFCLWAILHILFNFELFSVHGWIRVSQARLHGFGGFTFCLITLSAIPLYMAMMTMIIRTQKPLFNLPVPKFITKIVEKFSAQPEPAPEPEPTQQNESVVVPNLNDEFARFPAEMRGVLVRVRSHPNRISAPICNACTTNPNIYPSEPASPCTPAAPDFPLPPDFDFEASEPAPTAPVFQDINFYDDNDTTNESDDTPDTDDSDDTDESNPVAEYFAKTNRKFEVLDNDIALTDDIAITVHDDPEFWIMDEPIWFAAGQTRESPITRLLNAAHEHNVTPVLYLGATNIMNLDEKRKEWEQMGIRVVTKLEDL